MGSATVRCPKCKQYVPFKGWPQSHKCGVPTKYEISFDSMSHKEVLRYFRDNLGEIEHGLHNAFIEVGIFRGRIDLVARDSEDRLCLVEIVHKSNYDRPYWIRKLRKYRNAMKTMGQDIFKCQNLNIRLLMKRPHKPVQDVTFTVDAVMDG